MRHEGKGIHASRLEVAGHMVRLTVSGDGAPIVVVKPHRLPAVYDLTVALSSTHTVVQVEPLGFGGSDRPSQYPNVEVAEQVLTVLDHLGVESFVVWGYSQGGAMAATVALATPRVSELVVAGYSPLDIPSKAWLRRTYRDPTPNNVGQAAFWWSYRRFDWLAELAAMSARALVYVGSEDGKRMRGPRGIARTKRLLEHIGVAVEVFDGLDHATIGTEPELTTIVLPPVLDWLRNRR